VYVIPALADKAIDVTGPTQAGSVVTGGTRNNAGARPTVCSRNEKYFGVPDTLTRGRDVTYRNRITRFGDVTVSDFGHFDRVVVNVEVGSTDLFTGIPDAPSDEMVATNMMEVINGYQVTAPHLAWEGSDLVAVASQAGRRGLFGEAVLSATNLARMEMTRSQQSGSREQHWSNQNSPWSGLD